MVKALLMIMLRPWDLPIIGFANFFCLEKCFYPRLNIRPPLDECSMSRPNIRRSGNEPILS
jgi:hypothetical protein